MYLSMKVSIAIPTYNRKNKLKRLLNSISESTFKDYEIIVVDDASTDGTESMIKEEYPYVKYIKHEKPTLVAKSRNDAIEASEGDYIFFIDDDNVIERNTIEELVKFIESHEEVGTVAPVTCYYSSPDTVMYAGAILSRFMRRTISLYSGFPCKSLEGKVVEVDIDVIEHLFDTDKAIAEIRKVLRKDGFLVISTPNLSSFANRLLLLFGYQPLGTEVSTHKHYGRPKKYNLREGVAGHIRVFTYKALIEFLKDN